MNNTTFKPIPLAILMLLAGISASAYDFQSDGLCYDIRSEEDRTVEVTYKYHYQDSKNYVSGDIEIPRKVVYKSKTYTVTALGGGAFSDCSGLTSVTIPNSVTRIGEYTFDGCSGLTSLTIPNSVTYISYYAFWGCSGLTSVTIPISVTYIGNNAFSDCSRLGNITVDPGNANYSSIDGILFNKDATSLICCPGAKTTVTIPNSVTSIGDRAFFDCSNLEAIYVQSQVPIECAPEFPDNVIKEAVLYVPTGTLAAYKIVDPWRNFWNIEEMDFSSVEETAAYGKEPQISVVNGIIRIGNTEGNPLVEVFDISGKNVFRGNDTTVPGLANGIYIVKVGANVVKVQL